MLDMGLSASGVDLASNSLDPGVEIEFRQLDISSEPLPECDFAFCTDVMEHIPTDDVDKVFANIFGHCRRAFFSICTVDDAFGELIGEHLHLTVKPADWWRAKIKEHTALLGLMEIGPNIIVLAGEQGDLNVENELLVENTKSCLARDLPLLEPHGRNDTTIAIFAGGSSLEETWPDATWLLQNGVKPVAVNGTHDWLIQRGVIPSAMIMLDARPENAQFVQNPQEKTKYMLASQCHPDVFDALEGYDVSIWHAYSHPARLAGVLPESHRWVIPGGSTVVLRAIRLFQMLGFRKMHLFGWDSCYRHGKHHAYDQELNDGERTFDLVINDKTFVVSGAQYCQANEFMKMHHDGKMMDLQLEVHGNGLIRQLIEEIANGPHGIQHLQLLQRGNGRRPN